ncbi:hypothetical protein [Chitinimonas naiadis]
MNIPSLSSLLSSLPSLSNKTGNQAAPKQSDAKASDKTSGNDLLSQAGSALSRMGDALSKRVSQLNDAISGMANQLVQGFAKSLFGDAADGATISFDQTSLASSSSFAAAAMQSQSANGTQSAAGFSLEDSSEFKGHGVITTKDGRSFEFEVEISYSSSLQAVAAESTSTDLQDGQGQGADQVRGHGGHHGRRHGGSNRTDDSQPSQAATTPSATASTPLLANFPGNAADLLDRLTSEPVRLPFSLNLPATPAAPAAPGASTGSGSTATVPATTNAQSGGQTQPGTQSPSQLQPLLGSMLLRLLNLADGPRYLDLLPQATDSTTPAGRVDARA